MSSKDDVARLERELAGLALDAKQVRRPARERARERSSIASQRSETAFATNDGPTD